jgi:acetoin:2,6-dichlorophenolindophenol oxidoreductase subunit alpha
MPRKNKNQLRPRKSRPKTKRANGKTGAAAKKAKKAAAAVAAVLSPEKLRELYATMLKCRMLNKRVQGILAQGNRASNAAAAWREAVLVGALAHATPGDESVAVQDGFLSSFVRGTPLKFILAQLYAVPNGGLSNAAGQNADSVSQTTLEQGMTLAEGKKGSPTVVLAFAGAQRTERSALYEKLRAAAKRKLPVVCLVETSAQELEASPLSNPGDPSGAGDDHFPQIAVDGADAVAMFRVAQEAVRRARGGHGPSLIECMMPDNGREEVRASANEQDIRDPLAFMQHYLQRKALWSNEWQLGILSEFAIELNAAFAAFKNPGDLENGFDQTYSPGRPAVPA